jgi:ABC-type polysaccharide/polyol phosphate export permease
MPPDHLPWTRLARIALAFGWSDFLLKYHHSVRGYVWSLMGPVLQFMVVLHVFRPFVGNNIPHYALYLFLGIILWEHFSLTTAACIGLPRRRLPILQKVKVPAFVFVLSVGWTHMIILCTRLLLFFALALWWADLTWLMHLWYAPILLLHTTALALGIGSLLGAYSLRFQDIGQIWVVALQILFWLTPIVYPSMRSGTLALELQRIAGGLSGIADVFTSFIRLQPLSILLFDARRVFISMESALPSALHVVSFTVACLLLFAIGISIYTRRSAYFLQEF